MILINAQKVGYARVSTREQSENQNALIQQKARLEEAGVTKIFCDVESGANTERKDFQKLLELARQGKINTIVATRWDRLTRNEALYLELKKILQDYKVQLKLLDQGDVDLSTACGELSADMQAIFAVHERRMLRERVKRGYEYRKKKKIACQRTPWGYRNQDGKYVLDTQPLICLLTDRPSNYQKLAEEPDNSPRLVVGTSKSDIAKDAIKYFFQVKRPRKVLAYLYEKYGIHRKKDTNWMLSEELLFWNAGQSFNEWLRNPVLRGHTAYNKYNRNGKKLRNAPSEWEIHENTHPTQTLLTKADFQEIEAVLKANSKKVGTPGSKFYLTGLILCHECGHKCVLKRSSTHGYYGCRNSTLGCNNRQCIRLEKLDEAIIREFFLKAKSLNSDLEIITSEEKESPEITQLKQQLEGIENLLDINPNETLKRAKHELNKQIEAALKQSNSDDFSTATAKEILSHPYASHLGFWYTLNQEEREIIYEKLIQSVSIHKGEVVEVKLTI